MLLVAVLMAITVPSKQVHKEAMMEAVKEFVDEEAEERFGDNVLTNLGKSVTVKTIELALNTKQGTQLFGAEHDVCATEGRGENSVGRTLRSCLYLR